jgi:hypothetical protein
VDHTCYKCGAAVEEGMPFCPQCRAPQIRVRMPGEEQVVEEARENLESDTTAGQDAPVTGPFPPGTPGEIQPPAQPVPLPTRVRLRDAFGTASAASVVMIVAWMLVPAGLIIATAAAGALAVLLYARRRPELRLTTRTGARLGMYSGLISFAVFVVALVGSYLADRGASFRQLLGQFINAQANNPRKAELLNGLNSPEFMATFVVMLIIFVGVLVLGFSAVGGAIAAKLIRRRQ